MKKALCLMLSMVFLMYTFIPIEGECSDQLYRYDSTEIGDATIYCMEFDRSVLCFVLYNNNQVEFSRCSIDEPFSVESGFLPLNEIVQNEGSLKRKETDIIEIAQCLKNAPATVETVFSQNPVQRSNPSEAYVLEHADVLIPDWQTPVINQSIGGGSYQGINVSVKKTVRGDVDSLTVLQYYSGTLISSILSVVTASMLGILIERPLTLNDILSSFSWTLDAAGRYVASKNGTFYAYLVDNTRTKVATISGTTYYWAGWDYISVVHFADRGNGSNVVKNLKHSDYDNSISYFIQKAVENYMND